MQRVLIVGCGYLGNRIALRWMEQGNEACALTRSHTKAEQLQENGIRPHVIDWYSKELWPPLPKFDAVVVCVSHAAVEGLDPKMTHVLGLQNLLANLTGVDTKLVYLSTTGVYAFSDDGRWVDETSPVAPVRPGSIAAAEAEAWLERHVEPHKLVILRAAGIYGSGRIPSVENLRQQKPLPSDPESYLNLVHVDDLAEIAIECLVRSDVYGCFTVSDGNPVLRREYYAFIADILKTPAPVFASETNEPSSSPATPTKLRARSEGSKRISNQRIQSTLNYTFRYPTYRHGLVAAFGGYVTKEVLF